MLATLIVLVSASSPDTGVWGEATQAYRHRSYPRACQLFQKAARGEPSNGAIWSDLGLCLGKVGKKTEAVAALERAVTLGDAQTRLNAYYNLGALGVDVLTPSSEGPFALSPVAGCSTRWSVQVVNVNSCGTENCELLAGLIVGPAQEVASRENASPDLTFQEKQYVNCPGWCFHSCSLCGFSAHSVPDVLRPMIERCVKAGVAALRGKPDAPSACPEGSLDSTCGELRGSCEGAACDVSGKKEPEQVRALEAETSCKQSCFEACRKGNGDDLGGADTPSFFERCTVVSINPCAKVVGYVCDRERKAEEVAVPSR